MDTGGGTTTTGGGTTTTGGVDTAPGDGGTAPPIPAPIGIGHDEAFDCHELTLNLPRYSAQDWTLPFAVSEEWIGEVQAAIDMARNTFGDLFHSEDVQEELEDADPLQRRRIRAVFAGTTPPRVRRRSQSEEEIEEQATRAMERLAATQQPRIDEHDNNSELWAEATFSIQLQPCHPPDIGAKMKVRVSDSITSRRQDRTGRVADVQVEGELINVQGAPTVVPKVGEKEFTWGEDCRLTGKITPRRAYGNVQVTVEYTCHHNVEHSKTGTYAIEGLFEQELRERAEDLHADFAATMTSWDNGINALLGFFNILNAWIDNVGSTVDTVADGISLPGVSLIPSFMGWSAETWENIVGAIGGGIQAIWAIHKQNQASAHNQVLRQNYQVAEMLPEAGTPGMREIISRGTR